MHISKYVWQIDFIFFVKKAFIISACQKPYFGINCLQKCRDCVNQSCHQATGVCMENTGTDGSVQTSSIVGGSLGVAVVAIIFVVGIIVCIRYKLFLILET